MADKPRDGTRQDSRQARIAAGVLLLHERSARIDIASAVRSSTLDAADAVTRQGAARRAVALGAIVAAARSLLPRIQSDIARHRSKARQAASARLHAELVAIGVAVAAAHVLRHPEDSAHAESAAASLAAQWQAIAIAAAVKAHREERDVAAAIRQVGPQMRHRIERTAATEIASAYNDEHARALAESRQHEPGPFADFRVVRVWSAILDRRTCAECDMRDGKIIDGGDEPPLHPLCRCVSVAMTLAEAQPIAA